MANVAALAATLAAGGLRLVSGGTDVHLALVDLRDKHISGLECQAGEFMLRAIAARNDEPALAEIRREVVDLLARFPLYEFL